MNIKTSTMIFRIVTLSILLAFGVYVKYKHDKTKEMIQWNTKIINSIGVVSVTQKENAGLLIEILEEFETKHLTSLNDTVELKEDNDLDFYFNEKKSEKIPATPEQVIKDLQEIDLSVRAFASNNLFQKQTLVLILEKLRNKKTTTNALLVDYE